MFVRHTLLYRSQSGFTLVEMVMTIVIIAIVAAVLAPVITTTVTGFTAAKVRNDLTAQARVVLERLTREIREADPASIVVNGGGTSLTFTQITALTGLVDTGGTLTKTYSGCPTMTVSANGTSLDWDNNADGVPESSLANNLNSITFSYSPGTTISSGVVTVALTLADSGENIDVYREIHIRNTLGTVTCP